MRASTAGPCSRRARFPRTRFCTLRAATRRGSLAYAANALRARNCDCMTVTTAWSTLIVCRTFCERRVAWMRTAARSRPTSIARAISSATVRSPATEPLGARA